MMVLVVFELPLLLLYLQGTKRKKVKERKRRERKKKEKEKTKKNKKQQKGAPCDQTKGLPLVFLKKTLLVFFLQPSNFIWV
jgi:hypothetical protein